MIQIYEKILIIVLGNYKINKPKKRQKISIAQKLLKRKKGMDLLFLLLKYFFKLSFVPLWLKNILIRNFAT